MGLKVIIFLGPPRGPGRARSALRYQFGNYVSKPSRVLGVALFRWLCAERGIPEEVIIVGAPDSDWDLVHELAALHPHDPAFLKLGLRVAIDAGRVDQTLLDHLSTFIEGYLGGINVRCLLAPEQVPGRSGQLRYHALFSTLANEGDECHIDIHHDSWAGGMFSVASSTYLSRVNIGGLYLANPEETSPAGTPVLIMRELGLLVEWSTSLTLFRTSGLLGRFPELFSYEAPELSNALRAVNFAIATQQYDDLYSEFQKCIKGLRDLDASNNDTLAVFFARLVLEEATWLETSHLADWQIEFARRALSSMDYLRAATLAQEAVVSAAIAKTRLRTDMPTRLRVRDALLDRKYSKALYPVDPWPFFTLWEVRSALAGIQSKQPTNLRPILKDATSLHHFLERAISVAAVLVARFKRTTPY